MRRREVRGVRKPQLESAERGLVVPRQLDCSLEVPRFARFLMRGVLLERYPKAAT